MGVPTGFSPKRGTVEERNEGPSFDEFDDDRGVGLEPSDLAEGDLIRGPSGETREVKTTSIINVFDEQDERINVDRLSEFERVETRLEPVGFERAEPTGKFTPAEVEPAPRSPADRGPNGEFVSPNREPIEEFGRRDDGVFDLF
jgi:hypothetical protein